MSKFTVNQTRFNAHTTVYEVVLAPGTYRAELAEKAGGRVTGLVRDRKADLGINFPYIGGYVLGDRVANGKFVPDASGKAKVKKWHMLGITKEGMPFIGVLDPREAGWAALTQTGPRLVEAGKNVASKYIAEQEINKDIWDAPTQRTFAGIDKNNNLHLFITDGRTQQNRGLMLQECANFAIAKGCVDAIAGDGGGSTVMADAKGGLNQALNLGADERAVGHALLFFMKDAPAPAPTPPPTPSGYATELEAATAWVIAQGISDGTNPQGTVTREQLWAMMYRQANK